MTPEQKEKLQAKLREKTGKQIVLLPSREDQERWRKAWPPDAPRVSGCCDRPDQG